MRQDADFFDDEELDLVYIAKRLKEALRVEKVLTGAGFHYFVEPDTYTGGVIFRRQRVGAFFYVRPQDSAGTRRALDAAGYRPYDLLEG